MLVTPGIPAASARPLNITLHSLSARRDVRHSAVDPPPGPTADSLRFSFPNTDRGCSELMSAGRTGLKLGVLMPLSLNLLEAGAHDESSCFNLLLAHTRLVKQRETLTLSPSPGNCLCLPHRSSLMQFSLRAGSLYRSRPSLGKVVKPSIKLNLINQETRRCPNTMDGCIYIQVPPCVHCKPSSLLR